MKGNWIIYSSEELAWIEANSKRQRPLAHADFVQKFNRNDVSLGNFSALCKRKGWVTGQTGRFVKGQGAWNKGKVAPVGAMGGWLVLAILVGEAWKAFRKVRG